MKYALTLVTQPASEPVTLAQIKQHSRVDRDDEDSLLDGLIRAARQHAETFLRRQLVTATWRMSLDCFPEVIRVPLPPLQSATVTYVDLDGATQTLDPAKYIVDAASQPGRITPAYGLFWPPTRDVPNAVNVTFVAGYGAASAVPDTIKAAIKLLAGSWFENREAVTPTSMTVLPMAVESLLLSEQWGSL